LSKQFHPDINKEPEAREKFLAFSDAYAVLGNDRQRYVTPLPLPRACPMSSKFWRLNA
jgi:hypothetical protein